MKKTTKEALVLTGATAAVAATGVIFGAALYFSDIAFKRNLPAGASKILGLPSDQKEKSADELKWDQLKQEQEAWLKTVDKADLHITSEDGLKLCGTMIWVRNGSKRTVILVHGYHGNRYDFPGLSRFYLEHGYNVLLVDDRALGKSEGGYLGFGHLDRRDLVLWCRKVTEITCEDAEIILHGVSMGAAAVMNTAGEPDLPDSVKAVIEDCGFSSVNGQFEHIFPKFFSALKKPVILAASLISRIRCGWFFGESSCLRSLARTRIPVLMIHGSEDTFVPTRMVYDLYDVCRSEKDIYICEGAAHAQSYTHDPAEYEKRVETFLNTCVFPEAEDAD